MYVQNHPVWCSAVTHTAAAPSVPAVKQQASDQALARFEAFIRKGVLPFGEVFRFIYSSLDLDQLIPKLQAYGISFVRVLRYSMIVDFSMDAWLAVREGGLRSLLKTPETTVRLAGGPNITIDAVETVRVNEAMLLKLARPPVGPVTVYKEKLDGTVMRVPGNNFFVNSNYLHSAGWALLPGEEYIVAYSYRM